MSVSLRICGPTGEAAVKTSERGGRVFVDQERQRAGLNRPFGLNFLPARHTLRWTDGPGCPGRPPALALGISPQTVCQVAARGRAARGCWERLFRDTT